MTYINAKKHTEQPLASKEEVLYWKAFRLCTEAKIQYAYHSERILHLTPQSLHPLLTVLVFKDCLVESLDPEKRTLCGFHPDGEEGFALLHAKPETILYPEGYLMLDWLIEDGLSASARINILPALLSLLEQEKEKIPLIVQTQCPIILSSISSEYVRCVQLSRNVERDIQDGYPFFCWKAERPPIQTKDAPLCRIVDRLFHY